MLFAVHSAHASPAKVRVPDGNLRGLFGALRLRQTIRGNAGPDHGLGARRIEAFGLAASGSGEYALSGIDQWPRGDRTGAGVRPRACRQRESSRARTIL